VSDLLVAFAVFEDGTGAADIVEANEDAVSSAVARMARERGSKVSMSGSMSTRSYEALRAKAKTSGYKPGDSLLEMLTR